MAATTYTIDDVRGCFQANADKEEFRVIFQALDLIEMACDRLAVALPADFWFDLYWKSSCITRNAIVDICKIISHLHDQYSVYMLYKDFPQNKTLAAAMLASIREKTIVDIDEWAEKYNIDDVAQMRESYKSFVEDYFAKVAAIRQEDDAKYTEMCAAFLNLMSKITAIAKENQ